jgi:hypothetical protein
VEVTETEQKDALREKKRLQKEEELKNNPPPETPAPAPVEGEAPAETAETAAPAPSAVEDDEVKNFKTEGILKSFFFELILTDTLFSPVSKFMKHIFELFMRLFYSTYNMTDAEKARTTEREKQNEVDTLRREIADLEKVLGADYGPDKEYYALKGKSITLQDRQ